SDRSVPFPYDVPASHAGVMTGVAASPRHGRQRRGRQRAQVSWRLPAANSSWTVVPLLLRGRVNRRRKVMLVAPAARAAATSAVTSVSVVSANALVTSTDDMVGAVALMASVLAHST